MRAGGGDEALRARLVQTPGSGVACQSTSSFLVLGLFPDLFILGQGGTAKTQEISSAQVIGA